MGSGKLAHQLGGSILSMRGAGGRSACAPTAENAKHIQPANKNSGRNRMKFSKMNINFVQAKDLGKTISRLKSRISPGLKLIDLIAFAALFDCARNRQ
jgi:hypothetical protein